MERAHGNGGIPVATGDGDFHPHRYLQLDLPDAVATPDANGTVVCGCVYIGA